MLKCTDVVLKKEILELSYILKKITFVFHIVFLY